ncbi:hypothetical protein F66182_1290 [Fusarium sp. NRRL 66182]|nr:hypothetical protein F66182_1290 [Fusarium sp. NRRL 66182]
MADEDEGTMVVESSGAGNAQQSVPASSPLSSAPEPELDDASVKVDQTPDTPATSLAGPDTTPITPPRKSKGRKKLVVRKTARRSRWNADNILTDHKSPLASADLRSILSNPMAWDVLEKDEKAEILALFPDPQYILRSGTEDACPDFASLMNDDSFRHDCAAYTENIAQGRHDPEWLAQAWAAHERREAGDFDDYLDNKFNDEWEVELPPEFKTRRDSIASKEQSDVNMGNNEPLEDDENIKNVSVNMENMTTDPQLNLGDRDGIDELQAGSTTQREHKVVTIGKRRGSEMEVDELA